MKKGLKVIIPVAGVGTRLRPHTYAVPKPLMPVAGKPVLQHVVDPLLTLEPEELIFVVGHLAEQIVDFIKVSYSQKTSFVWQNELQGLGFAIYLGLKEMAPGPLLIVLGDTIAHTDYPKFVAKGKNVVGLKEVEDPRRFGVAIVKDGMITEVEEKPANPKSNLALIGLYYFEDSRILLEQLEKVISLGHKTSGEYQLTDALAMMIKNGEPFTPYIVDGWYDCGKKETFLETNRILLTKGNELSPQFDGSIIIPPVNIAPSAVIYESIVGPYVSVSEGAHIHRSIVKDCIIGKRAHIEYAVIENSLIGEKATVKGTPGVLNISKFSEIDS
jgi:glucose-1-phosphate thymidylyltransferase